MYKLMAIAAPSCIELSDSQLKSIQELAVLFRGIDVEGVKITVSHVSGAPDFKAPFESDWAVVCAVASQIVSTQMLAFKRVMQEAREKGHSPWAVKNAADGLACAVVKRVFDELANIIPGFYGHVIASEGVKDGAPGIRVGAVFTKHGRSVDITEHLISVDPIDGTSPFVAGRGGATTGFSVQQHSGDGAGGGKRVQLPDPLSVFATVTGPNIPSLESVGRQPLDPRPSQLHRNIHEIAAAELIGKGVISPSESQIKHRLSTAPFMMMNRPYQNAYIVAQLNQAGCAITAPFDKGGKPDLNAVYRDGEFAGLSVWEADKDKANFKTRDGRLVMVDDGNWTLHLNRDVLAVLGNGGLPEYVAMVASASNYTAVLLDKKDRQIKSIEATAEFILDPADQKDYAQLREWFGQESIQAFIDANPGMTEGEALAQLGKIWDSAALGTDAGFFTASALTTLAGEGGDGYPVVHPKLTGAVLDKSMAIQASSIVASRSTAQIVSGRFPLTVAQLDSEIQMAFEQPLFEEALLLAKELMEIAVKYGLFEKAEEIFSKVSEAVSASVIPDDQIGAVDSAQTSFKFSRNLGFEFIAILRDAAEVKKTDVSKIKALVENCKTFKRKYHVSGHEIGGQINDIQALLEEQLPVVA